jgi:hypothetical protein
MEGWKPPTFYFGTQVRGNPANPECTLSHCDAEQHTLLCMPQHQ